MASAPSGWQAGASSSQTHRLIRPSAEVALVSILCLATGWQLWEAEGEEGLGTRKAQLAREAPNAGTS